EKDVKIFSKEAQIIKKEIQNIDKNKFKIVEKNFKNGKNFSINLKIKDKNYLISFICVKDCEGKTKAYFVIYKPDKIFGYLRYNFIIVLLTTTFLLTLVFSILYIYFWKQIEYREKLKKILETDTLTGIANRRAFIEKIKYEAKISQRFGYPLSVILFDIDNLKKVNDIYGHDTGDYVLKEVVKIISGQLKKTDFFA
ncbi:MAG: GGDEF domain-containing protein, partial [Candidatus Ratteibacteria bacterium]